MTDYIYQEKSEEEDLPASKTVLTYRYNDLKTTSKNTNENWLQPSETIDYTIDNRMTINMKQKLEGKQPNPGQNTKYYNNQQKKRTCIIVDFAVPADPRIKLKENEKKDKYLDFVWELKKLRNIKWQLYKSWLVLLLQSPKDY